jgi:hypothetical protein
LTSGTRTCEDSTVMMTALEKMSSTEILGDYDIELLVSGWSLFHVPSFLSLLHFNFGA